MENNNVNTPPITQTLFSFVSLRNPQLSDDDKKKLRFVEKQSKEGVFENAVHRKAKEKSKIAALQDAAKGFTALTEAEIKAIDSNLYEFSVWLVRNKSTATNEEILKKATELRILSEKQLSNLWDNLIYQVVTQKEFYAKETLIQLLLANHVVAYCSSKNKDADTSNIDIVVDATVVLPKVLFIEDATKSNKVKEPDTKGKASAKSAFMQQQQAIQKAQTSIEALTALATALRPIEKQYEKAKNEAAAVYQKEYDAKVKSILDDYKVELETSKNKVLETGKLDIGNVEVVLPEPELPVFDFMYAPEVSTNTLQSKLVQAEKNTLATIPQLASIETFAELKTAIQQLQDANTATIINNTEDTNRIISVGGVLLLDDGGLNRTAFQYELTPKAVGHTTINFDMAFAVPDSTWQVSSMLYHLRNSNGSTNTNGYFQQSRTGNIIFLANLYNQGIAANTAVSSFRGTITFTNGVTLSFEIDPFNLEDSFIGTLIGTAVDTGGDGEETPTETLVVTPFIPKGFGYKQIGIADYKRVEQTTHNYVPGEVAHIENIMAREYKEKATRRLRRDETTSTTSTETERENLTDTSSTSRFDLQNEVSKVLQQSKDFSANASAGGNYNGKVFSANFNIGANYATHSSKDESTRQAITEAKEITQKALDRLVTKVKEERVVKMLEEYEENNMHGFDNKKGDKHVTGVYRWLDKLMKNRIVNYGKRLMFEFMIPQPAKLHLLGLQNDITVTAFVKPDDPRKTTGIFQLADYTQVTETTAKYWSGKFNATIKPIPEQEVFVGHAFDHFAKEGDTGCSKSAEVSIPEGYVTAKAAINITGMGAITAWGRKVLIGVGNTSITAEPNRQSSFWYQPIDRFVEKIPVSFAVTAHHTANAIISIACELTTEARKQWQLDTFNTIIESYSNELEKYNQEIANENDNLVMIKDGNPNFYRQIENTILRKNCISYLVDENPNRIYRYGRAMTSGNSFTNYKVNTTVQLDEYTAFAKFLEQAFEWNLMSYNLLPYYWGNSNDWLSLYQAENVDPIFRSFLQSGMARVVVTVRPGFEAAVLHYMSTGQIWNGGQVPVIGDELYLSLVDELKETTGKPEGKAWLTRIPTTLTMLQANSAGLKVDSALPQVTNDIMDFEDPSQLPDTSCFELTDAQIGKSTDSETGRFIENMDINNGNLQFTDDGSPRQVVAQISLQAIKQGMGL